jgi:hypothetical protein
MILRILNPPHAGAQAEIGTEPLTVGSGPECDLVLTDPLLQPEHCRISRGDGEILVELTGGAAHLDGQPVEKSPFAAKPGQVLSIGSTHIAFGEPDSIWTAIAIPELKSLGGTAPEAAPAETAPQAPAPIDSAAEAAAKRKGQIKIAAAAGATAIVFAALAAFFYRAEQQRSMQSIVRGGGKTESFFKTDPYSTNADNKAAEAVAERVRREVSGASVTVAERSGRAFLQVFVRTRAQAADVQKIVNASPQPVFSEIVSLKEVEQSAEMMASMKGYKLDVTFAKDGTAYWSGYLPSESDWRTVRTGLEADLPFVKSNVSNITYASEVESGVLKAAKDAGIPADLVFDAGPKQITIGGSIPENKTEDWLSVLADIRGQFGSMVDFVDNVSTGKAVVVAENPFHTEIVGVTLDSLPAVILLDGQRIYEGAILRDGSVLTKISEQNLILTGSGGARSLPLGKAAPQPGANGQKTPEPAAQPPNFPG